MTGRLRIVVVCAVSLVAIMLSQASTLGQQDTALVAGPQLAIDTPANGSTTTTAFAVSGWALDLMATAGTGIDAVHVYAFPSSGSPVFLGAATYGLARPDVSAALGVGSRFSNSGYSLSVPSLAAGSYTIQAFGHSSITGVFNVAASATVMVRPSNPVMAMDVPASNSTVANPVTIQGWALDLAAKSGPGVDAVHVYAFPSAGGAPIFLGAATTGLPRPDVGAYFGAQFTNAGYRLQVTVPPGNYAINSYMHSTASRTFNMAVGKSGITVMPPASSPQIGIDTPSANSTASRPFSITGWAVDTGAATGTGIDAIHVWAYPVGGGPQLFVGAAAYGTARPDIGALFGNSRFNNSGYSIAVTSTNLPAPGTYDLYVNARSVLTGTFTARVVRVTVASDPVLQPIISTSRRIDWTQAGVVGGVPNRTALCATLSPGATAAQINSAIASCPAGQVVQLTAGTFNLSSGIDFNARSNVTLRGAGPEQTSLVFTGGVSCGGLGADICLRNGALNSTDSPGNTAAWTGGYSLGTTSITLSHTTNLAVGSMLILDQLDDSADGGGMFVCQATGVCATEGPGGSGRSNRVQEQIVRVTAINGTTVTISPGLYLPNWRSSQSPGAWWSSAAPISMSGIEDLSVNHAGSGSVMSGTYFFNAYNCWIKNVKSMNANRNHVWLYQSAHVSVRDSYFYGTRNAASQSYGIETYMNSDSLVENNIFQHVTVGMMTGGSTSGTVYAYNYSIDDYYNVASWMQSSSYFHDGGIAFVLFEGNEGVGFTADAIHGTANFGTLFRNVFIGWETGKSLQTVPVHIYAFNRFMNVVGNVLGRAGYHNRYESAAPSGTNGNTAIYTLGWSGNGGTPDGGVVNDARVKSTSFRWGNYDVMGGSTVWNVLEVPTALGQFANAVPLNQILPASMYLPAKPSWWGATAWPAIGPDVTGGQDPTGHAFKIPAHSCYDNTSKTNGILNFNARNCY